MNENWLENLEEALEKQLNQFLQNNPSQELLLKHQQHQDHYNALQLQKKQLVDEAKLRRRQLLELAATIQEWRARTQRAKKASANSLAIRAERHLASLMKQGRQIWSELDHLGNRFHAIQQEILVLSEESRKYNSSIEEDWNNFIADQELEQLKKELDR